MLETSNWISVSFPDESVYKQQLILCLKLSILLLHLELTNSRNVRQGQKMEQKIKDIIHLVNHKPVLFCVRSGRLRWIGDGQTSLSSEVSWCKPTILKEIYCIPYQVIASLPVDFISIQDVCNWVSFIFFRGMEGIYFLIHKYIPMVTRTVISVEYQSVAGSISFLSTGPNTFLYN